LDLDLPFLKRTWTQTWTCPFKVDLDLDLDLRIGDLDLDLDLAVAGLVTSLGIANSAIWSVIFKVLHLTGFAFPWHTQLKK